jgi:hypothetical protein
MYALEELKKKSLKELKEIGWQLNVFPAGDRRCRQNWIDAIAGVNPPLLELLENSPGVEVDPVEDQQLPECVECFDDGFVEDESGVVKLCQCGSEPRLSRQKTQRAIAPEAKTSLSADPFEPKCSECFDDGYIEDEFGRVTVCSCNQNPKLSRQKTQSAIEPAANISKSDLNPILTGVALSDRFLARYAPPQSETLHYDTDGYKVDTEGQLSLFDVHVQSPPEPPDPDDFESLDEFREAIARWDWGHPSSSEHCSDHLPSSVHSEPLEVSLDSFCEWAPCPLDWYEPADLLEPSEVSELSDVAKSSITSEFFIPTFGRLGDRSDKSDEPPDTGVFARLPKPKPPSFPPTTANLDTSRNYPETIPKLSRNYPETIWATTQLIRSGANQQPARSPPGGDA